MEANQIMKADKKIKIFGQEENIEYPHGDIYIELPRKSE